VGGVAVGEPRFVTSIDAHTATVTIGPRRRLMVEALTLEQVTWVSGEAVSGDVLVQYRAHGEAVPAKVEGDRVVFEEPQQAVAAGQTATFYREDEVLGGGIISATHRLN